MTAALVRVRIAGGLDVESWRRRHELGEVPDAWPYGLDRLAAHGVAVRPAPPFAGNPHVARAMRAVAGYEWWETRRTSAGIRPDVELCWHEGVGVPAAWLARGTDRPRLAMGVIWLTDERRRSPRSMIGASAVRAADRVWALSSAQLPVLRDDFGVPARRLAHLPFGVDAAFFRPAGIEPAPGLVASVGNDRHRDHRALVAAIARVRRAVPHARLELATRAPVPLPDDIGVRHEQLSHTELRDLYRRSEVVAVAVRPNLHVSGVTAALEAMASGRPVVITDTPGMRDYIAHGETGLLVPPGDEEALAGAITGLLLDPARAAALGSAGRRAVEQRFNTASQARRLAEILA